MTAPQSSTRPGDRLNGWKEIAAFLGKGVRTAQRWERELGLPVHRIGHEGGEIVYAFRSEIERWSRRAEESLAGLGDDGRGLGQPPNRTLPESPPYEEAAFAAPSTPHGAEATGARRPRRRRHALAAALVLCAALALLAYVAAAPVRRWTHASRPRQAEGGPLSDAPGSTPLAAGPAGAAAKPAEIADARLTADGVEALDASGKVAWKRQVGFVVNQPGDWIRGSALGVGPVVADLDGDGSREVSVALRAKDESAVDAIHVFEADGRARFTVSPDVAATFGDRAYAGPWAAHRVFVTGSGRQRMLWAVFVHRPLFPSLVQGLDAQGHVRSTYWSNGHVEFVGEAMRGGRPVVLVGAGDNEHKGASLAVFDGRRPDGSAPAVNPKYRCTTCPAGGPDEFIVFPRACWQRLGLGGELPGTRRAWVDTSGRLNARIDAGHLPVVGFESPVVPLLYYALDPDLREAGVEVDQSYLLVHRELQRKGTLDHPFNDADRRDLLTVLRWENGRFVRLRRGKVTQ